MSLRRLVERPDVNAESEICGWGAGGAEKIRFIISVLQDLGIDDIATLVDGDKDQLHSALKNDSPGLRHGILPTDDISDKKRRPAVKAKKGRSALGPESLSLPFETAVVEVINNLGE